MAIDKLGSIVGMPISPAVGGGKEAFGQSLGSSPQRPNRPGSEVASLPVRAAQSAHGPSQVGASRTVMRTGASAPLGAQPPAHQLAQGIDRVAQAQRRLDHILHVAESGKTFTPAELLALQAQVYQASNELDLAGKVVDKATGGIKQVLQTQV